MLIAEHQTRFIGWFEKNRGVLEQRYPVAGRVSLRGDSAPATPGNVAYNK